MHYAKEKCLRLSRCLYTLLLCTFLFYTSHVEGVYLLLTDDELPYSKLKQAYDQVLIKYDYPMCLALSTKMAEYEICLGNDPLSVDYLMENKLQAIDPSLHCLWVPTSLFQFFVLKEYFENSSFRNYIKELGYSCCLYNKNNKDEQDNWKNYTDKNGIKFIPKIDSKVINCLNCPETGSLKQIFHEVNTRRDICAHFLALNRSFISWCQDQNGSEDLYAFVKDKKTIEILLKTLPKPFANWIGTNFPYAMANGNDGDFRGFLELLTDLKTVVSVFESEVAAHQLNQEIIFRGAELVSLNLNEKVNKLLFLPWKGTHNANREFILDGEEIESYALSYGNSFLGGVFFSLEACAAKYVHLNHSEYAFHGIQLKRDKVANIKKNLYAIPLLHPFAEMLSSGEWFHVHSKVAVKNPEDYSINKRCPGFLNHPHFLDRTGFLLTCNSTPLQLGLELISLVGEKGIIFFIQGANPEEIIQNHKKVFILIENGPKWTRMD